MDERMRFVLEYERGLCSMTELCGSYEIARETGYVWLRRYAAKGWRVCRIAAGRRMQPGNRTPEQIEAMVLELRREHMRWGPRKLKWVLEQAEPGIAVACGEHHRRAAGARRPGHGPQEATARAALHPTVCCGRRTEPGVVRRFQGLVPHPGRRSASIR